MSHLASHVVGHENARRHPNNVSCFCLLFVSLIQAMVGAICCSCSWGSKLAGLGQTKHTHTYTIKLANQNTSIGGITVATEKHVGWRMEWSEDWRRGCVEKVDGMEVFVALEGCNLITMMLINACGRLFVELKHFERRFFCVGKLSTCMKN